MKIKMAGFHQPVIGKRGGVALNGGFCVTDEAGNRVIFHTNVTSGIKWTDAHAAIAREVADILSGKPAEVLP